MSKQSQEDINIYQQLATAYYKETVQEFAISDALNAHGVTYIKEHDYMCHAIEEILDGYAGDLCSAILDLITNDKVILLDDSNEQVTCKTIDELLDVYGLSNEVNK